MNKTDTRPSEPSEPVYKLNQCRRCGGNPIVVNVVKELIKCDSCKVQLNIHEWMSGKADLVEGEEKLRGLLDKFEKEILATVKYRAFWEKEIQDYEAKQQILQLFRTRGEGLIRVEDAQPKVEADYFVITRSNHGQDIEGREIYSYNKRVMRYFPSLDSWADEQGRELAVFAWLDVGPYNPNPPKEGE